MTHSSSTRTDKSRKRILWLSSFSVRNVAGLSGNLSQSWYPGIGRRQSTSKNSTKTITIFSSRHSLCPLLVFLHRSRCGTGQTIQRTDWILDFRLFHYHGRLEIRRLLWRKGRDRLLLPLCCLLCGHRCIDGNFRFQTFEVDCHFHPRNGSVSERSAQGFLVKSG